MVLLAAFAILAQTQPTELTMKVDGVERTALVFAPSVPSAHPPVVWRVNLEPYNSGPRRT